MTTKPDRSIAELTAATMERLAVVAAIDHIWASGRLDPLVAVAALLAIVGVISGERLLGSKRSTLPPPTGGAVLVLALACVGQVLGVLPAA